MATLLAPRRTSLRDRLARADPAWTLLGTVLAARTALGLALGPDTGDDAYITFRYARNLADGHGFVYNAGEHVLGTTTPLWTLLLTPFQAVGLSLPAVALVLALAFDVLSALALRSLLDRLGYARAVSFGAAILFVLFADYLGLARSGMETSLFVLLVLLSLERLARQQPAAATWAACGALLTRPEGALALAVVAVWGGMNRRLPDWRRTLPALALLAAWVVFATAYFGSPLPQSIVAKSAGDERPALAALSWNNVERLFIDGQYGGGATTRTWIQGNFVLSLLALAGLISLVRRRDRLLLLAAFPLGYLVALSLAHAFTYFSWYYAPVYPFLAALAVIGLAALLDRTVPAAVAALVALQLVALIAVKLPGERHHYWVHGLARLSKGIPAEAGTSVAATEIGVIGWNAYPAHVDDMAGLVTPAVVGRWRGGYILRTRPDYIALRTDIGAQLVRNLTSIPALRRTYRLVESFPDPQRPFQYRLYRRVGRR
jgi:hypothetical protein